MGGAGNGPPFRIAAGGPREGPCPFARAPCPAFSRDVQTLPKLYFFRRPTGPPRAPFSITKGFP